jgi:hypothetical protein
VLADPKPSNQLAAPPRHGAVLQVDSRRPQVGRNLFEMKGAMEGVV